MPRSWDDVTPWQQKRATEALIALAAALYTTFDPGPDIPYGPVDLEAVTYFLPLAVVAWWVVQALVSGVRRWRTDGRARQV